MDITLTAKIKISPTIEQAELLQQTLSVYRSACNYVSALIHETKILVQAKLHHMAYRTLRANYSMRSQMAQSVMKTVIARYRSLKSNGHEWTLIRFKKPEYDLVWNRDYSLVQRTFSVNTLEGRIKVPFETKGMEHYFDGSWTFGTAKLVYKHGKFFLHIPMTKDIPCVEDHHIRQVVGVDLGVNFLAVAYDSQGKTTFFHGQEIKHIRAKYKRMRKALQQKETASARRKLKKMGQREHRWMTDVNHTVSKVLVRQYGERTLFVLEDLTGIREKTERVHIHDRYETVSWAFHQFREMLEYKARLYGSKVVVVDPHYTSLTCPKCGHTEKANRNKRTHMFCCQTCGYTSNDDRIGEMNLQRKGIEYIVEGTAQA